MEHGACWSLYRSAAQIHALRGVTTIGPVGLVPWAYDSAACDEFASVGATAERRKRGKKKMPETLRRRAPGETTATPKTRLDCRPRDQPRSLRRLCNALLTKVGRLILLFFIKRKEVDLYSAFIEVPYTQGAQVRITQCYLQTTPYLPLRIITLKGSTKITTIRIKNTKS